MPSIRRTGLLSFHVLLCLAGVGALVLRIARDNDDLLRAVLVIAAGSALPWFALRGLRRLPRSLTLPAAGLAAATFMAALRSPNPADSLVEFMKMGMYLLIFLGLAAHGAARLDDPPAARTGRRDALPTGSAWRRRGLAAALGGLALLAGAALTGAPLSYSAWQVGGSLLVALLCAAAFAVALGTGTLRGSLVRGCLWLATAACAIGIPQFWGMDPLRPWDPPIQYTTALHGWLAEAVASLGAGRWVSDHGTLVLAVPRIMGIFGNPDFSAPYLMTFLPLAASLAVLHAGARWRAAGLTLALGVALVLTGTWGAWLALGGILPLTVPLLLYARGDWTWRTAVRRGACVLAAGVLLAGAAVWYLHASGRKSGSIEERLVKTLMAAEMWRQAPVAGVGLNAYRTWYPLLQQDVRLRHGLQFELLGSSFTQENRTHNDLAQLLAETGVTGVGMFAWLMAALLAGASRRLRRAGEMDGEDRAIVCGLLGGLATVLVYALPNFPFHIVSSAATFWIFAGLLASWDPGVRAEEAPVPAAPRALPWMAAATAVLTLIWAARLVGGTIEFKRGHDLAQAAPAAAGREAARHFSASLRLDSANATVMYEFGALCFNLRGDPELAPMAEPLLRRSLASGSINEDAEFGLGAIEEGRGNLPEALRRFTRALALRERHPGAREGQRRVLTKMLPEAGAALAHGDTGRARALYEEAFRRDPGNYLAAYQAGVLAAGPGRDLAGAADWFERAAASARNDASLYAVQAQMDLAAGRMQGARAALARATLLDPSCAGLSALRTALDPARARSATLPG